MNKREFAVRPYATLSWQLLVFSLAVTLALDCFIESRLVWLLPVFVLMLSVPYLVRALEALGDLRRGRLQTGRLKLLDISEEYVIAVHTHRGLVHWTLIFEDENQSDRVVVLSAAARRADASAFFQEGARYQTAWLPRSRIIRSMERTEAG